MAPEEIREQYKAENPEASVTVLGLKTLFPNEYVEWLESRIIAEEEEKAQLQARIERRDTALREIKEYLKDLNHKNQDP